MPADPTTEWVEVTILPAPPMRQVNFVIANPEAIGQFNPYEKKPEDLGVLMARERIKRAISRIIEVEPLANDCAHMADADLEAARERLWQILGKLDDEADQRTKRARPEPAPGK